MSAGKSFGKFVAEDLLPGQTRRVYLAHQRNAQELGGYVIKVVSVAEAGVADVSASARRWLDGISLQDRVAQDWHDVVAPVVERPTKAAEVVEALNSGEVWYVTRRYAGSLKELLDGLGGNPATALAIWTICRSLARGALAFKQTDAPSGGRRSHGNLKSGNILFSQLPLVEGQTEIVVSDPAPILREGAEADPKLIEEQFERSDLVALGRVLFQLVAGRALPEDWNWTEALKSPDGDVARWRQVFAKSAGTWRTLCQELLEAGSGAKPVSLADVEHRLGAMQPRVTKPVLPKVLAIAAVLVVTGIISAVVAIMQLRGEIVVHAPGGGITAEVTVRNRNRTDDTQTRPLVEGIAEFKVRSGNSYEISLVPTGEYRRLVAPAVQRQNVKPRSRNTNDFYVAFATLVVSAANESAQPVVAELSLGGETNVLSLPVTLYLPPTNRQYQLSIDPDESAGVYPSSLAVLLDQAGQTLATNVVLQTVIPGVASVNFRADVRLPLTYRFGTNVIELGREAFRVQRNFQQGETVAVAIQPPHPWPEFRTNWTVPGVRTAEFPRDFFDTNTVVQLNWSATTDPNRTEVFVATGSDAPRRIGSALVSQASIFPPADAEYRFVFQRPGYKSVTNAGVRIRPGVTNLVVIPDLEAIYGFVVLSANLPGFKVYTNNVLLGVAEGTNVVVNLPPFASHELLLAYSNEFGLLEPRKLNARVDPGETNRPPVQSFDYVEIQIETEPADANVYRLASAGERLPLSGRRYLQSPTATNNFLIEARHYHPTNYWLNYPQPRTVLRWPVRLDPILYPVVFEASPPSVSLRGAGDKKEFKQGVNSLAFGDYRIEAYHPMLGSQVHDVKVEAPSTTPEKWSLPFGTVSVFTGQSGLEVRIYPEEPALRQRVQELYDFLWPRDDLKGMWQTPVTNATLAPGNYQLVFSDGGESATNRLEVALNQHAELNLPQLVFLPAAFTNSLGMVFAKLPGQSVYISLEPVNRSRFNQLLNAPPPVSYGDLPVVSRDDQDLPAASLENMLDFCKRLTAAELNSFKEVFKLRTSGWEYQLPSLGEWQSGATLPQYEIASAPDPLTGRPGDLPEVVVNGGRYFESQRDPNRRALNLGGATLRNGRDSLSFRVVLRRTGAGL